MKHPRPGLSFFAANLAKPPAKGRRRKGVCLGTAIRWRTQTAEMGTPFAGPAKNGQRTVTFF